VVEQDDMEMNVFEITMTLVRKRSDRPPYPNYPTSDVQIGIASSLINAENLILRIIERQEWKNIHHLSVREVPIDCLNDGYGFVSMHLYDYVGKKIDEASYSTMNYEACVFEGRKPDEIRFVPGDIVEVQGDNEIHLAYVVDVPVSSEHIKKIPLGDRYYDDTDDTYIVMTDADPENHEHIHSLALFKPRFKIPNRLEKRLKQAYIDYLISERSEEIGSNPF